MSILGYFPQQAFGTLAATETQEGTEAYVASSVPRVCPLLLHIFHSGYTPETTPSPGWSAHCQICGMKHQL